MSKIRDRMVTAEVVSRALDLGMDPLELSIKKWERVCKWLDTHSINQRWMRDNFGFATCGLCMAYYRRWEDTPCDECPLAQRKWGCLDHDSPYDRAMLALEEATSLVWIQGAKERAEEACREMLDALQRMDTPTHLFRCGGRYTIPRDDRMTTCTLLQGHILDALAELPENSVHCIATSPPYYGLRKYVGDQTTEWPTTRYSPMAGLLELEIDMWRGELGAEPTLEMYVGHLVLICRELRRVLREDGTFWLNLGDAYGHGTRACRQKSKTSTKISDAQHRAQGARHGGDAKQLLGVPWRVALALQADGWWLRSDIIWEKSNCMPESVTDRPTKSHEYVFLLTKSARYFYDAEAIREPHTRLWNENNGGSLAGRSDWTIRANTPTAHERMDAPAIPNPSGRNKRTVWRTATASYKGAHFAVFPPALVEPCILGGTSEKGRCPKCGAPWKRIRKKTGHVNKREPAHVPGNQATKVDSTGWKPTTVATNEWKPTCSCNSAYPDIQLAPDDPAFVPYDPVPCVVLDPFVGSGTTCAVATKLGRDGIGIDISNEYLSMAEKRIREVE